MNKNNNILFPQGFGNFQLSALTEKINFKNELKDMIKDEFKIILLEMEKQLAEKIKQEREDMYKEIYTKLYNELYEKMTERTKKDEHWEHLQYSENDFKNQSEEK
jgi:hypothetical protein